MRQEEIKARIEELFNEIHDDYLSDCVPAKCPDSGQSEYLDDDLETCEENARDAIVNVVEELFGEKRFDRVEKSILNVAANLKY